MLLGPSSIDTIAQQVPLCKPADLSRPGNAAPLGRLEEATQWQILHHNPQRPADCFQGRQDFGVAFARGRRQWVAHSQVDSLGVAFTEEEVAQWVGNRDHPRDWLPWPPPPPPPPMKKP